MIITCPHCQTKYQVTFEAIGSAGRKVQCAHCNRAWDQKPVNLPSAEPEADRAFDAMAEDALDEAFMAEAKSVEPETPKTQAEPVKPNVDAAALKKRQADFTRRQTAMFSRLPLARLRRTARILSIGILATLLGGAYFGRVAIVERYPDFAGVYEALGLGVNIVGLEFAELETLQTLSSGKDVLMVSAQIVGLSPQPVAVPPVVISLLDDQEQVVYEWSVTPRVRDLMAGERATFDTRLSLPPSDAARVRLSFAANGTSETAQATEPTAPAQQQPAGHDAPADPETPAAASHDAHATAPASGANEHH